MNQNMNEKQQIVIVGGGMVGISLALMLCSTLSKDTIEITLVEQHALQAPAESNQPSFDDRSTALSSGTADLLREIDCWSCIEKHAEKIHSVHVSDKGHFGGIQLTAKNNVPEIVGYVVENKQLGGALIKQLQQKVAAGVIRCVAPARVSQCIPKQAGYELHIDDLSSLAEAPHVINADLLLIADGAESPLRSALGIEVDSSDYKQSAIVANVALSKHHGGIAYERFTDEGPIALLPLPTLNNIHRAALVWTLPEAKAKLLFSKSKEELVKVLQTRFGFRAGKINDIGERYLYPLNLIQSQEQVRSHLVVVGNAAHLLHPVAGQGFNLSLRDCWVLSECLRTPKKKELPLGHYSNLKQYVERRSFDQSLTIGLTDNLVKLFSSSRLPQSVLRQLSLLSLNTLPYVKNQFAQKMMGSNRS